MAFDLGQNPRTDCPQLDARQMLVTVQDMRDSNSIDDACLRRSCKTSRMLKELWGRVLWFTVDFQGRFTFIHH